MNNNPPSNQPRVSVVIPCRNEAGDIWRCLSSVLEQELPAGGMEVIVADGMSDDGTREILARFAGEAGAQSDGCGPTAPAKCAARIRMIDNPGRIASTGLNAAIRAAQGSIIVRMDAHTEYSPDYVRRCVELLQSTGAENVGGSARTTPSTYLERAVAAAYHSSFSVGGARFHKVDYEGWVDTITYGCWRRETFERFGYFDEELVRNQDDEHNLRIIRGGGRVWQSPAIQSWYRPRGSLGALFRQYLQYGYWKVRVIQKHKLPASWRHLVPAGFLLALMLLFLLSAGCGLLSAFGFQLSSLSFQLSAFSFALFAAYLLAVFVASLLTAATTEWTLFPILPAVFGCYHFGYGLGFLRGLVDFVILRRRGAALFRPSLQQLTR